MHMVLVVDKCIWWFYVNKIQLDQWNAPFIEKVPELPINQSLSRIE